jgi:hypothetical protein
MQKRPKPSVIMAPKASVAAAPKMTVAAAAKPFRCSECRQRFANLDLYLAHHQLHEAALQKSSMVASVIASGQYAAAAATSTGAMLPPPTSHSIASESDLPLSHNGSHSYFNTPRASDNLVGTATADKSRKRKQCTCVCGVVPRVQLPCVAQSHVPLISCHQLKMTPQLALD